MLDGTSQYNTENLTPYFWVYAPIASEIDVKKPKKFSHHQTISDLVAKDPVLANRKAERFWDSSSIIPIEKRKIVLWEQTHPLPNGSDFPEQPIYDLDQTRILSGAIASAVKEHSILWGGKGLVIGKNMTSASLSLAFNDEADRNFHDFLSNMNAQIKSSGLSVGDHRTGSRRAVVKLAKRAVSRHQCDDIKDMAEKLANKFGKLATCTLDIQDVRVGMSLYNTLGERVSSRDVAVIPLSNGMVKWQQKSRARKILTPVS